MRTTLLAGFALVAFAAPTSVNAAGVQGTLEVHAFPQGAWRSLLYQLPGAYRFLDRLDLTEEQQKALTRIYNEWAAERRGAYRDIAAKLPQLSAEDRKDPEKLKAYMIRYAELYKAAQIALPIELVDDVLSDAQLAKIREATRVMEEWEQWLAAHMAKYAKTLDELLGPVPAFEAQGAGQSFVFRTYESLVKGGELFGRLGLSSAQTEELKSLWGQYQTEYGSRLTALGHQSSEGPVPLQQQMEARRIIAAKTQEQIRDKYSKLAMEILTPQQRDLLAKATDLIEERNKVLWERYEHYVFELSAIMPMPTPAASPSP